MTDADIGRAVGALIRMDASRHALTLPRALGGIAVFQGPGSGPLRFD
jgi:hypothetical protein